MVYQSFFSILTLVAQDCQFVMGILSGLVEGSPLTILALIYSAIIGSLIGSFYTASTSRVLYFFYGPGRKTRDGKDHRWKHFLTSPSACPHCQTRLQWNELVPVLSFLFLKGKCKTCKSPIGIPVLLGESLLAVLLPLLLATSLPWISALFAILFAGHLYISIATDYFFLRLDHENTIWLYLWAGAYSFTWTGELVFPAIPILTGLGSFALFLILYYASGKRGLGFADVLLAGALGLFFSLPGWIVVMEVAAGLSILYAVFVLKNPRAPIPFGTFLGIASILTIPVIHLPGFSIAPGDLEFLLLPLMERFSQ